MFFPIVDHKTVSTNFPGGNNNDNEVVFYTTEYPCFVCWEEEFSPGCFAGYDIYTYWVNGRGRVNRQVIFSEAAASGNPTPPNSTLMMSNVVYIPKAGVQIRRYGTDDDCGGSGKLHIWRLPQQFGQ